MIYKYLYYVLYNTVSHNLKILVIELILDSQFHGNGDLKQVFCLTSPDKKDNCNRHRSILLNAQE